MTNEFIVILGRMGSGKTVMARHCVEGKPRLVVYDPMRQFSDLGTVVDNKYDLCHYIRGNLHGNFKVIYQPEIDPNDEGNVKREEFKFICKVINSIQNVYFLVDEIDTCLPPTDKENGFFENLLARARHAQISLIATTIRYVDVKRKMTAQAHKIFCFHMHEKRDIEYFKGLMGKSAEELKMLPPYHYFLIDTQEGTMTRHEPIKA